MQEKWIDHEYEQLIREAQVNMMAHVDNIAYLQIFEAARWEMLSERGFGFEYIQKHQIGPVILGVDVQYRKEVFLRQRIKIRTLTTAYEGKVLKLRQQMLGPSAELCCQADYSIGLFDSKTRKLILPTPAWLHACGLVSSP